MSKLVNFCPECEGMMKIKKIDDSFFLICKCGYKKEMSLSELEEIEELLKTKEKKDSFYFKHDYRRGF